MKQKTRKPGEVFWPKVVLKKWLNISNKDSDFSADEGDDETELDEEENCDCDGDEERQRPGGIQTDMIDEHLESVQYKLRRRNSETFRAQYINTKELRICIGTWNVGGKIPPDDLDITEWLDMEEPADIYVFGVQEIVPLNAGNVFGAEDSRPILAWENLIREKLNRIQPAKPKYKCYSDPPSPSRFNPSEDAIAAADELLPETDSDSDGEDDFTFPILTEDGKCSVAADSSISESNGDTRLADEFAQQKLSDALKRLDRLNHFSVAEDDQTKFESSSEQQKTLLKTLSRSERFGLVWPEQPLDLLAKHALNTPSCFKSSRSFRKCMSFRPARVADECSTDVLTLVPDVDLDALMRKKKRPPFVRIISKQMIGIFLSIWVRHGLRKCIQNVKVSTIGVGAMGYIGNKGSVSVSMSIYQTLFCFVCSHLSSGEKTGDVQKRNADVQEIHRRTRFTTAASAGGPRDISDHERIFWLGDLNYRIDLPYEKTHDLVSKKDWFQLAEKDQLKSELKKGRAFDGWTEGIIKFPPTYKYMFNSEKYIGDDQKGGRRSPAWCDRVLSLGKGIKLLNYRRAELKLSDHRPVVATFMAEVEVFCHRKLQRALTLTDSEVEDGEVMPGLDFGFSMQHVSFYRNCSSALSV